jgi:serine/threonine-protein kinase SRPK3
MSESQEDIDTPVLAPPPPQKNPLFEQRKDDEEGIERYQPGGFHPVYLGEIYKSKYRVLQKLGCGRYSTVWLVKDEP